MEGKRKERKKWQTRHLDFFFLTFFLAEETGRGKVEEEERRRGREGDEGPARAGCLSQQVLVLVLVVLAGNKPYRQYQAVSGGIRQYQDGVFSSRPVGFQGCLFRTQVDYYKTRQRHQEAKRQ